MNGWELTLDELCSSEAPTAQCSGCKRHFEREGAEVAVRCWHSDDHCLCGECFDAQPAEWRALIERLECCTRGGCVAAATRRLEADRDALLAERATAALRLQEAQRLAGGTLAPAAAYQLREARDLLGLGGEAVRLRALRGQLGQLLLSLAEASAGLGRAELERYRVEAALAYSNLEDLLARLTARAA